jgi:hypothetical protein
VLSERDMEDTSPSPTDPLRALLHEWFVKYNPVYLFSAALVLVGLTLVSCDLADEDALGGLGVTGVAELYAFALIGGAALLRKLGRRRVAVMVGLLAALYQCDLTMHVETCAFLPAMGWLFASLWALLFAVKLRLLAAALELRLSPSAFLVPTLGAASLAVLPQLLRTVPLDARASVLGLVVFAIGAAALWTPRTIESAVGFDYRGRRAIRGVWLMWSAGAALHVAYWLATTGVGARGLLPAAALLSTRWVLRERSVWARVILTLAAVALLAPTSMPAAALMAAVVLALRAMRTPVFVAGPTQLTPPYRGDSVGQEITSTAAPEIAFETETPIALERLLLGAATSAHLSVWTACASGGVWLAHVPVLDAALVVVCALAFWGSRRWQTITPLVPLSVHLAIQLGWLTRPRGPGEWGVWSIGIGFALLATALGASWRAHRREAA